MHQQSLLAEEHHISNLPIQFTPEQIEIARREALDMYSQLHHHHNQSSSPSQPHGYTTDTSSQNSGEPANAGDTTLDPETRQQEAETLMTLFTGFLQEQGSPISINDLSGKLLLTVGSSWGEYFEQRHGSLLLFLRKYMIPGVHILLENHWFGLEGMTIPSTSNHDAIITQSTNNSKTTELGMNNSGNRNQLSNTTSSSPIINDGTNSTNIHGQYLLPDNYELSSSIIPPPSQSINPWTNYDMEKFDQSITAKRDQELKEQQYRYQLQLNKEEEEEERKHNDQLRLQIQQQTEQWERYKQGEEKQLIDRIRQELSLEQDNRNRQIAEDAALARRIAEEEHLALTASAGMNSGASRAAVELRRNRVLQSVNKPTTLTNYDSGYNNPANNYPTSYHHRPVSSLSTARPSYTPSRSDYSYTPSHASTFSTDIIPHHALNSSSASMIPYSYPSAQHSNQPSWDPEAFAQNTVQRGVCAGDDINITPADFDVLFRPMLVHGFTLIKHGRQGTPKKRRFWMTNSLTRLYWDSSKFLDVVVGTGERSIELSSIIQIVDGVGTDLLRRKVATGAIYAGHEGRFLSLVTTDRTFDLECSSRNQQMLLIRAFNWIVNRGKRSSSTTIPYAPIAASLPPPPPSLLLLGNHGPHRVMNSTASVMSSSNNVGPMDYRTRATNMGYSNTTNNPSNYNNYSTTNNFHPDPRTMPNYRSGSYGSQYGSSEY